MIEYNGRVCATYEEITSGIMTPDSLLLGVRRGKIDRARRACRNTPALFVVETLPPRARAAIYHREPDTGARAVGLALEEMIEPDAAALNFYQQYQLPDGRYLSFDKQAEYANNAAILNAFRARLEATNSERSKQSHSKMMKSEFWRKAALALPRVADTWPNSLPANPRRLQEKFRQYLREGYPALVTGKFGTRNAAVVATPVQQAFLVKILSNPLNHDSVRQMEAYNEDAKKLGWKPITRKTVDTWKKKLDLKIAAARGGETKFDNTRAMMVKRSRTDAPLKYWTMDGWTAELFYQRVETRDGCRATTYMNRLVLLVVLDPCAKYPIGYAIGERENTHLARAALRDAANHTAALFGRRYRTNQLQCDNFLSRIKAMKPVFATITDKFTPARLHNAKAKVIEPYFKYLNKTYCQGTNQRNWSGFEVTASKDLQPNSDFLDKYKHSFPDEEGCRRQLVAFMEKERAEKREQYVALFANLPEERRLPLSDEQYLYAFGEETGFRNAIEGMGLRPTIGGIRRDYDCFDIKFREHAHVRWAVKYDPDNLDRVLAINEDGTLRFLLERKHVQPMALVDRREGDAEQLARVNDYNKRLKSEITDFLAEANDTVHQLDRDNPRLEIARRLMIPDSLGRQKIYTQEPRRLKAREIDDIEAIPVTRVSEGLQPPADDDDNIWKFY